MIITYKVLKIETDKEYKNIYLTLHNNKVVSTFYGEIQLLIPFESGVNIMIGDKFELSYIKR